MLQLKKNRKKRVYLDYNIYIDSINPKKEKNILKLISMTQPYISVSHIEEYYNACECAKLSEKSTEYMENNEKIKTIMIRDIKGILNPTETVIKNKPETFDECLERIRIFDTRNVVKEHGKNLYEEYNVNIEELDIKIPDNNYPSYSDIWETEQVKNELSIFPQYLSLYKDACFKNLNKSYGFYIAMQQVKKMKLSNIELTFNYFKTKTPNFSELELIIEFLHNVLNKCNYYTDETQKTCTSGIHDVSHSIYGTYCDYFITQDIRLIKKLKAIYYYLGIDTKVLSLKEALNMLSLK